MGWIPTTVLYKELQSKKFCLEELRAMIPWYSLFISLAYENSYLCTYNLYGLHVMFLMRADPFREQVGGGCALEIETSNAMSDICHLCFLRILSVRKKIAYACWACAKKMLAHTQHALIKTFKFGDLWVYAEHAVKICPRMLSMC